MSEITKHDKWLAMADISHFYRVYQDLCPSCGWVLKDLHPAANLYPHFTGACKKLREAEYAKELTGGAS
jgi:hypothetical protein